MTTENPIDRLVEMIVANHTPKELALGYLRYETVRRLSPRHFGELHKLNLSGQIFDDLIDQELKAWKEPKP